MNKPDMDGRTPILELREWNRSKIVDVVLAKGVGDRQLSRHRQPVLQTRITNTSNFPLAD